MLCAIHQPNFFPWLGYFDKIRRADVFVFLDDVQYPRSGSGGMGSWTNRVRIAINGQAQWIRCPVRRAPLETPIRDVVIDDDQPWRDKLVRTLDVTYRRAPGYAATAAWLSALITAPCTSLADFNIAAVQEIARRLGLESRFVRQSQIACAGAGTELLISITRAMGCDAYLAGGGAGGYQQDALIAEAGIGLVYQNFSPTPYGEPGRFIPGLSVIDYLMHGQEPGRT